MQACPCLNIPASARNNKKTLHLVEGTAAMGHGRNAALLKKQRKIVVDQFGCKPEGGANI
jgi:hypothetical protein